MVFPWPTVGTVDVNGVRLGYREAGDPAGAALVLLHGTGSNACTWDRFTQRINDAGYRVIALDLRGHASSTRTGNYAMHRIRDDVLGLLGALDLRDVTLIGHSVGAYAALAAALHSPHLITRLVLEDPAAPPARLHPLLGRLLPLLTAAVAIATARREHSLRSKASIFLQLSRPDPAWWSRLLEVRQPTLILSGGPTSFIPPQRLAQMTAAIADVRLATIPVGHRIHSLAPDEFLAEVAAFLAEPALRVPAS
jgi:3-oxoadipate enol-lactonase